MPATPQNGPRLVAHSGPLAGQVFPLRDGVQVIGRDVTADLSVAVADVSRKHASLHLHGDTLTVTDMDSRNGTAINGERISGPCPLRPGDVLSLGSAQLSFEPAPSVDTAIVPRLESRGPELSEVGGVGTREGVQVDHGAPANTSRLGARNDGEVARDKEPMSALKTILLIVGGLGTMISAFVGLYPMFHHSSDHGVGAYQKLVQATCSTIHASASNIDVGQADFTTDPPTYNKGAVVIGIANANQTMKSQYDALNSHTVPAPLQTKWNRAERLQKSALDVGTLMLAKVQAFPGSTMTQSDFERIRQEFAPTAIPVVAQLDDAMTTLAGATCKVSPN